MKYFSIALHIFTGPRSFWGPSMGPSFSIIETLYDTFFNFVDVTLADDDTNSILLMVPMLSNSLLFVLNAIYASSTR